MNESLAEQEQEELEPEQVRKPELIQDKEYAYILALIEPLPISDVQKHKFETMFDQAKGNIEMLSREQRTEIAMETPQKMYESKRKYQSDNNLPNLDQVDGFIQQTSSYLLHLTLELNTKEASLELERRSR